MTAREREKKTKELQQGDEGHVLLLFGGLFGGVGRFRTRILQNENDTIAAKEHLGDESILVDGLDNVDFGITAGVGRRCCRRLGLA